MPANQASSENVVYLMDASAFIHRAYHAIKSLATRDGRPTNAIHGFTSTILKLMREKRPELLAIVYDSRHEKRRHELYPDYKANRGPMEPALAPQIDPIREIVDAMGLKAVQVEGLEADDVIAAMCKLAVSEGRQVVIVSGDKDFYQLLGPNVSMYDPDPKKKSALSLESFRERFSLDPPAFLEVQGLMGDSSDNIPGVPGVGEITAFKLIQEFGTIDNLYQNLDKVSSASVREKLARNEASARISKRLAVLGEGLEAPAAIDDLALKAPDLPALRKILRGFELEKVLSDIENVARARAFFSGGMARAASKPETEAKAEVEAARPGEAPGAPPSEPATSQSLAIETAPVGAESQPAPIETAPDGADPNLAQSSSAEPISSQSASSEPKTSRPGPVKSAAAGPKAKPAKLRLEGLEPPPAAFPAPTDDVVDYDAYVLVKDEDSWKLLTEALEKSERLAVDLETDSPKPRRANVVGVSLATGPPGEAFYIPVAHETSGAPNQPWSLVVERIGPYLTGEKPLKAGQHAKFDWQILARRGLVLPPPADDPMLASYLLDPDSRHGLDAMSFRELNHQAISYKAVVPDPKKNFASVDPLTACKYSAEDADLTLRLAQVLRGRLDDEKELLRLYEEVELPLEELLGRMEGVGVLVDPVALKTLSADLGVMIGQRAAKIFSIIGREINLASPKQLSDALFVEMGLPSGKKTAKGTGYSTDNEVLTDLAPLYPIASEIIAWRELSKLRSTYADKLPEAINPATGRIHTSYNQALTATGRLSSSDPNLQNIPAKSEEGRKVRAAFKAPPSSRLVSADYSQIELRVMAHFSGDKAMRQAFLNDEDIHAQTASRIFGVPLDQVPPDRRREAKTINFGIIYGQGPFGLAKQLGIPQSAARTIIESYFSRFPGVRDYMDKTMRGAERSGLVRTWFGRLRRLPHINIPGAAKREAERMAINTPIQGTAADIIKMAMLMVDEALRKEGLKARIIMQVHDELVLETPCDELEAVKNLVKDRMELAGREPLAGGRPLEVPLKVDVADGEAWVHA